MPWRDLIVTDFWIQEHGDGRVDEVLDTSVLGPSAWIVRVHLWIISTIMEVVCSVNAKKINTDLSKLFAPSIPAVILRTMSNLRIRSGQRSKIMRLLHRPCRGWAYRKPVFHQLPASAVLRLTIIYSSVCTSHGHGSSSQLWKDLLETRVNIKVGSLRIWASQPCTRSPWITSNREA